VAEAGELVLRRARPDDAAACAAVFNDWVDATEWMPRVHPHEDVMRYYFDHVLAHCEVTVAEVEDRVRGFLTLDCEGLIAGFYLAPELRGRGIGHAMLATVKARAAGRLRLWTFVANEGARRFYAREGFVEAVRTDGDNEEGLPDVMLEWRPA
jgi:GNAT superfamily N-acetyltransferase